MSKYGTLKIICGPMFSGKTTDLLKNILWAKNGRQRKTVVFKTSFDNRYAEQEVVSHEGLQTTALSINKWHDVPEGTEIVFFDEVQFFCEPQFQGDLIDIVANLLHRGIDVTGGGLDMDSEGKAFPITAQLMAMADEVTKLKSHCAVCGQPATKTYRKAAIGGKVQLGGADLYEPRCTKHWSETRYQDDLFIEPSKKTA